MYAGNGDTCEAGAKALRNVLQLPGDVIAWRGESHDSETGAYRYSFDVQFFVNRWR